MFQLFILFVSKNIILYVNNVDKLVFVLFQRHLKLSINHTLKLLPLTLVTTLFNVHKFQINWITFYIIP